MEYEEEGSHRPAHGVAVIAAADSAVEADDENVCFLPSVDLGTRPPKPWEGAVSSSGHAPFKPPSPGSTPDVVESSDARCREFLPSDIDPY